MAEDLGRDVGAVPGRVGNPVAEGTNQLLAEGAHLIRDGRDVLDALLGPGQGGVARRRGRGEPGARARAGARGRRRRGRHRRRGRAGLRARRRRRAVGARPASSSRAWSAPTGRAATSARPDAGAARQRGRTARTRGPNLAAWKAPGGHPSRITIAGSDSGGGAGIQADLKAFARCGVHGTSAIVALTAQNTLGVTSIHTVPPEMVIDQVRAVTSDIGVDAVKIGMLGDEATIAAVDRGPRADRRRSRRRRPGDGRRERGGPAGARRGAGTARADPSPGDRRDPEPPRGPRADGARARRHRRGPGSRGPGAGAGCRGGDRRPRRERGGRLLRRARASRRSRGRATPTAPPTARAAPTRRPSPRTWRSAPSRSRRPAPRGGSPPRRSRTGSATSAREPGPVDALGIGDRAANAQRA